MLIPPPPQNNNYRDEKDEHKIYENRDTRKDKSDNALLRFYRAALKREIFIFILGIHFLLDELN